MNRFQFERVTCLICICFFSQTSPLEAQIAKGELQHGKTVETTINKGEKHRYTVKLEDRRFLLACLEQQGVDVKIVTYDPGGEKMDEFDSPNGTEGPEFITLVSKEKGDYTLEVSPLNEESRGPYTLRIDRTEKAASTPAEMVDQLFAPWDNPEVPGAVVVVVRDGRILFKNGYGSANLEYDIPNTPSTVFHIASVSKQFTAFSILLLAEEGKLSLDDDVRKYLPEVPDFGNTITLRHLALHTSGLRDQWSLLAMAGWRLDDVITREHILKLVSRQKELNFNPGEEHLYSNTGYTLLAEVVARVSGRSFAEFTKEHIFEPLNMISTLFYDDHEKIVKNRAYSYYSSGYGYKKSVLSYANVGATSLFTTVEDLSRWALNFEDPKVGNRHVIDQMDQRGILNNGDTLDYALGQGITRYKGLKLISHDGADAGYRAFLGRFPDQRFSVAVFSNNASFRAGSMGLKVADIYLKDLEEVKEKEPESEHASGTEPFDTTSLQMADFTGNFYSEELGASYTFVADNNKLIAKHIRLSDIELTPTKKDIFSGNAWFFREIEFLRDPDGRITGCKVSNGRVRNLWFEKVGVSP